MKVLVARSLERPLGRTKSKVEFTQGVFIGFHRKELNSMGISEKTWQTKTSVDVVFEVHGKGERN